MSLKTKDKQSKDRIDVTSRVREEISLKSPFHFISGTVLDHASGVVYGIEPIHRTKYRQFCAEHTNTALRYKFEPPSVLATKPYGQNLSTTGYNFVLGDHDSYRIRDYSNATGGVGPCGHEMDRYSKHSSSFRDIKDNTHHVHSVYGWDSNSHVKTKSADPISSPRRLSTDRIRCQEKYNTYLKHCDAYLRHKYFPNLTNLFI